MNQPVTTSKFRLSTYGTIHHFQIHPTLPNVFYQYGNDHDLSLWDLNSNLIQKFKGNKHQVTVAIISKTNKFNIIISANGEINIYNQSEVPKKISLPQDFIPLNALLIEHDAQTLLLVTATQPQILCYQLEFVNEELLIKKNENILLPNQQDHQQWITEITMQNDIIYAFQKELIDVWKYQNNKFNFIKETPLQNCQGYIMAYSFFLIDQNQFLAIGDSSGQLLMYQNLDDEFKIQWKHKMISAVLKIQQMRIQKNDFIIAGTFDNGLDILDLKGHKIKTIDGRSAPFIWWSEQNILVSRASEHTHYACIDQY